jgi:hypothetical protein
MLMLRADAMLVGSRDDALLSLATYERTPGWAGAGLGLRALGLRQNRAL